MRCTSYYMLGTPFSSLELFVAFSAFLAFAGFCFLGDGGGGVFVLNEWLLLQSEESLSDLTFLVSAQFLVGQNLRFLTGSSLLVKQGRFV